MDVFLLSAGFGTRLKPFTDYFPKCLAPVGTIPLLAIWLDQLSRLNFVSRVYINCHHLADQIRDFLAFNKYPFDITLIVEETILGTSISIKNQLSQSSEHDFMIIHGDNLSLQDFSDMHHTYVNQSACNRYFGLALGFESHDYNNCGFYTYNPDNYQVISFIEKPGYRVNGLANGALFMMTRELLLKSYEQSNTFDFCKDNLPAIVNYLCLFKANGIHVDIGSPNSLASVQCYANMFHPISLHKDWHRSYTEKVRIVFPC